MTHVCAEMIVQVVVVVVVVEDSCVVVAVGAVVLSVATGATEAIPRKFPTP